MGEHVDTAKLEQRPAGITKGFRNLDKFTNVLNKALYGGQQPGASKSWEKYGKQTKAEATQRNRGSTSKGAPKGSGTGV